MSYGWYQKQSNADGSCVCLYKGSGYGPKPQGADVYNGLNACIAANPKCTGQEKTQVWHRQDFSPSDPDWKPNPFNDRKCACIPGEFDSSKVNHGNLVACYQSTECKPIDDFWEPTLSADNKCVCQRASSPSPLRKYYGTALSCSEQGGGKTGCDVPKMWIRAGAADGKCLCQPLWDIRDDGYVTYSSPDICAAGTNCHKMSDVRYLANHDQRYCTDTTQEDLDFNGYPPGFDGPYYHLGNCINVGGQSDLTVYKVDPEKNDRGRASCGVCPYDYCANLKKDPLYMGTDVDVNTGTEPGKPNLFMCFDSKGNPSGPSTTDPILCGPGKTCCNIRTCDGRQDPCVGRWTETMCISEPISTYHSCAYYNTEAKCGTQKACIWTKGPPAECRLKSECKFCSQNQGKGYGHPLCVRKQDSCD